nr:LOW QUALITY PROTEIN: uncharacterized protein LOC119177920 [Rhipicephalus microplus]
MSPNVPLLVQVLTGCLFASTGSSAFCTGQLDLRHTFDAPFRLGTGIVAGDIFDTPVAPRLQPEHHLHCAHLRGMMTSPVQPASATPAAIKGTPIASSGSGHGNQAARMSPNVPLLVQVGDWKYGFRSDDPCLIVLPCPHTILSCISDCFALAGQLLSLSGDVEQNPGPITDAMFKELLETQKNILSKISQMLEQQASSESAMIQVPNRLLTIDKKLECIDKVDGRLLKHENAVHRSHTELSSLCSSVYDLENRSRRNNVIIRGVKEEGPENDDDLVKKINDDIFGSILNQKLNSIERIHTLGKKFSGKDRPVILRVADYRDKVKMLKNCFKLKGTHNNISEDYSKRVTGIRRNLWVSSLEERKKGAKVRLVYDKVLISNVLYTWSDDAKEKIKCKASAKPNHK